MRSEQDRVGWPVIFPELLDTVYYLQCTKTKSYGTAWVIAANSESAWLATSYHNFLKPFEAGHDAFAISSRQHAALIPVPTDSSRLIFCQELDLALFRSDSIAGVRPLRLLHDPSEAQSMKLITVGSELGWIGYHEAIQKYTGSPTPVACTGRIAAHLQMQDGANTTIKYALDGAVNRGASGAPVFSVGGEVVGMIQEHSAPSILAQDLAARKGAFPGFGIVLPIAFLVQGLEQLQKQGMVKFPMAST